MAMTNKGIKMNISKCLKPFNIKKSKEVVTEIRGQHEITNGYRFIDHEEEIILYWHDDNLDFEKRLEHINKIYGILEEYGFSRYIHLNENVAQIILKDFLY